MKTHIVKISNSQGVRIPKALLEQTGLSGEVMLEEEHGRVNHSPLESVLALAIISL